MAESVAISLPFPPSTNNLFVNRNGGRRISSRYEMWRADAGTELLLQKPEHIEGQVSVTLEMCPQTKRKRDADNCFKAVLDLLVAFRVIEADDSSIVRKVSAEWREQGEPCIVRIEPYAEPLKVAA